MLSSLELVPSSLRRDPQVQAACAAIDIELHQIYNELPSICFWPFIDEQVPPLLDVLAWEMHVDVWQGWGGDLTVEEKRDLINKSIDWHQHKGTKYAVESMLKTIFKSGYVSEWYQYGGNPYFFRLVISEQITPEQLAIITDAIYAVKNARSWMEGVLSPQIVPLQLYIGILVIKKTHHFIPVSTNSATLKVTPQ